jgi:hypothetical protein
MSANLTKPTPISQSSTHEETASLSNDSGKASLFSSAFERLISQDVGVRGTGAGTIFEVPVEASTGEQPTSPWDRLRLYKFASDAAPASRLYPHLFDENESAGKAVAFTSRARGDMAKAIEAFGEADLEAVDTYLKLVAVATSHAHGLSDFNKSFAALAGYIRRACLIASSADCSRSSLNVMAQSLRYLEENPTLTLMDAARWSEQLRVEGWNGDMPAVERLFKALVDDLDLTPEQKELFEIAGSDSRRVES